MRFRIENLNTDEYPDEPDKWEVDITSLRNHEVVEKIKRDGVRKYFSNNTLIKQFEDNSEFMADNDENIWIGLIACDGKPIINSLVSDSVDDGESNIIKDNKILVEGGNEDFKKLFETFQKCLDLYKQGSEFTAQKYILESLFNKMDGNCVELYF